MPPDQVVRPHLPIQVLQEVYGMKLWGKISYDKRRKLWFIDGNWEGKRKSIYLIPTRSGFLSCPTKDLAVHLQLEISREIAQGTFHPNRYKKCKPLHMAQFAKDWLALQKPNVKYKTWVGYRGIIENYIIPLIGNEYLPYINYEKLLKFNNDMKEMGASTKSCKNRYAVLYKILRDAKKSGYISKLPEQLTFDFVTKKKPWLSMEKQFAILDNIPTRHCYIYWFIFATGVRPSEARALRRRDLNYEQDEIDIKKTMSQVKGGEAPLTVKNKREEAIPLYEEVKALLKEMPRSLSEYVFINPDTGKLYNHCTFYEIWRTACLEALGHTFNLKNAGRHSLASQILADGGTFEDVRNALRHSTEAVSRENYADPNKALLKATVDRMRSGKWTSKREAK
jgi:integrase